MRRLILTLVLVATACGTASGGDDDSGTTTTTTTTSSTTTTTTAPEPCIDTLRVGRPTVLEPSCVYSPEQVDGTFSLDLNVTMEEAGWVATVNRSRVMRFAGPAVEGLKPEIDVIIMPSDETIEALTERISTETRSHSEVMATDPIPARVGGQPGVTLDVSHPYDPTDEDICGESLEVGLVLYADAAELPPGWFGPDLCTWTRVWILEINDLVVVILGGDARTGGTRRIAAKAASLPDTRPTLEAAWDQLVSGITFCTDEMPCDR